MTFSTNVAFPPKSKSSYLSNPLPYLDYFGVVGKVIVHRMQIQHRFVDLVVMGGLFVDLTFDLVLDLEDFVTLTWPCMKMKVHTVYYNISNNPFGRSAEG